MISLTRLNKVRVVINSDLIKFIEDTPDTVVTLVSGEKLVVAETVEEVVEKILRFRRQLMHWSEGPRPLGTITSAHAENGKHTEE
jgi:flagellar protein FlbD